mgnify:CR=1 FL=1
MLCGYPMDNADVRILPSAEKNGYQLEVKE